MSYLLSVSFIIITPTIRLVHTLNTPQRPSRPAIQNLRFAPSPEYEVIEINEDGWTESSGSRPTTPTPPGPSEPSPMHQPPRTPHLPHTPHLSHPPRSPHTPHTPKSPRAGPHSQGRAATVKAQKKKSKKGSDVSTFYEIRGSRRYCIFCQ